MRTARRILIDKSVGQHFHIVSRVVDRRFIFSDREKRKLLEIIRQFEIFSGVKVLSYCFMSNHFHLLVSVQSKPAHIESGEIWTRMKSIYTNEKMDEFSVNIRGWEDQDQSQRIIDFYDRMRERMYDLSAFVKDFKLKFSKWYNKEKDRKGTLWEERFRSTLVEGEQNALMNTAAYIELNPVRAGIVSDPKDYNGCSYSEAMAGGMRAREGIIRLSSLQGPDLAWKYAMAQYRAFFIDRLAARSGGALGRRPLRGRNMENDLTLLDRVNVRIRHFSAGLVLGSREFIKEFYEKNRSSLNPCRTVISRRINSEFLTGEMHSYRDVSWSR